MPPPENYEALLGRLYSKIPTVATEKKRFEVPHVQSMTAGSRTFIQNFRQISEALNREKEHVLRYFLKELATAGSLEGEQAVFQGKFYNELLRRLTEDYVQAFIICPVCKGPDTKIVKEDRLRFLVCEACGAKSSVRQV
ncbi:MAG: translation initiation factor IF-2 subunit beta [Candidatus Bathyarchaeia archaeon]